MNEKSLPEFSEEEIKQAVEGKYSQVAASPKDKFNFPVGKAFAISVGYPEETLNSLAAEFSESFTGAGNPQTFVDIKEGGKILDLGCGAGLDLYFYAKKAGTSSKLYGLDISEAMLEKAKRNLKTTGINNVEFLKAPADRIPLPDASLDVVLSNGIYNLSPDKEKVMREVYRVLKPGGRTIFSEIILSQPLEEEIRKSINDWFRCIGGALTETEFNAAMLGVGFKTVKILAKGRNARTGHKYATCANIAAFK